MGQAGRAGLVTTNESLQTIPGIGPSLASCLVDIGFSHASELRGEDPERMYSDLCEVRGERMDPCVLYVFRCAVYFVSHDAHDPELLKWWSWKGRPL